MFVSPPPPAAKTSQDLRTNAHEIAGSEDAALGLAIEHLEWVHVDLDLAAAAGVADARKRSSPNRVTSEDP